MLYDSPRFFRRVETLEDLKRQFRAAALECHPDCGGTDEDMARLNAEYEELFRKVSGVHRAASGSVYEKDAEEASGAFPRLISELLRMGLSVEVCGSWVWVGGDTRPRREELKAMGAHWSAKKGLWYFAPAARPRRSWRGSWSMERIRGAYGSTEYAPRGADIAAA